MNNSTASASILGPANPSGRCPSSFYFVGSLPWFCGGAPGWRSNFEIDGWHFCAGCSSIMPVLWCLFAIEVFCRNTQKHRHTSGTKSGSRDLWRSSGDSRSTLASTSLVQSLGRYIHPSAIFSSYWSLPSMIQPHPSLPDRC